MLQSAEGEYPHVLASVPVPPEVTVLTVSHPPVDMLEYGPDVRYLRCIRDRQLGVYGGP